MPLESLDVQMGPDMSPDAITEVVQSAARKIDSEWAGIAKSWKRVLGKASKGSMFGRSEVPVEWLYWVLFQPPSKWPSKKHKEIAHLAVDISKYSPLYEDVQYDGQWGRSPDSVDPSTAKAVFERFLSLFEGEIADPMFKVYRKAAIDNSAQIMEICNKLYPTPCSRREAVDIFFGDLERLWKSKALDVSPAMYRALPSFIRYVVSR